MTHATNRIVRLGRWTGAIWIAINLHMGAASGAEPVAHWKCTTDAKPWVDQPDLPVTVNDDAPFGSLITADSTRVFQVIDGWGGCFNERGWKALQALSEDERAKVIKSMFDPKEGLKLNLCRTPIGASDYGITLYSLDETADDYAMDHFSIARDRERLIPYIKAALAQRTDLRVWGVPWSPPSWMKDSGQLAGGHIKDDAKTFDALALYFAKYVQAYRAEGIPLYMVMPQNEPCYSNRYTSCIWTGQQIAEFVGKHLGPMFRREKIDCEIYIGTFAKSTPTTWDYLASVAPSLNDPAARGFISGVGCQWGGDQVMRDTHFRHPELKLMQSEAECGNKNTNDWTFASHQFEKLQVYLEAGANSSMIWNLVLDETGLSTDNWAQCSPIVVNQTTKQATYTPYYYGYRHFSSFVKPGARRIAVEGSWNRKLAFVNPDGEVVVVLENTQDKPAAISLCVDDRTIKPVVPAKSFSTFTLAAK